MLVYLNIQRPKHDNFKLNGSLLKSQSNLELNEVGWDLVHHLVDLMERFFIDVG